MNQYQPTPSSRRAWHQAAPAFFCPARSLALLVLLLFALLAVGGCCAKAPPDPHAQLRQDLDTAIEHAAHYLAAQQDERGAWPSKTYGLMRDGVALTPHVLRALSAADKHPASVEAGLAFVAQHVSWTRSIPSRPVLASAVRGPVYFVADTVLTLANVDTTRAPNTKLKRIDQALTTFQIFDPGAPPFAQHGGWGYGSMPFYRLNPNAVLFDRFEHGRSHTPIAPNLSANISATAYALDTLPRLPRIPVLPHEPLPAEYEQQQQRFEAALAFATRCQNYSTADPRFDDGGFFFNPADAARNKGGPAGTDAQGYARFHSAGSSTADGLRVLLRCGLDLNAPRVAAARGWLFKHFDAEHHPGTFNDDRAVLRDAYYFYYAASVADTFTLLGEGPDGWQRELADALIKRQGDDGSFVNPFTDGKEDDPLVATAFALRAMVACRRALEQASVPQ